MLTWEHVETHTDATGNIIPDKGTKTRERLCCQSTEKYEFTNVVASERVQLLISKGIFEHDASE